MKQDRTNWDFEHLKNKIEKATDILVNTVQRMPKQKIDKEIFELYKSIEHKTVDLNNSLL